MHSLFNQVDLFFNQKPVTLLNYGPSAKTSHLTSALWYGDTAGKMDNGEDANAGLVARRKLL